MIEPTDYEVATYASATPTRPPLPNLTAGTASYIVNLERHHADALRDLMQHSNGKKGWLDRTIILLALAGSLFSAGMTFAKVGEVERNMTAHVNSRDHVTEERFVTRREFEVLVGTMRDDIEEIRRAVAPRGSRQRGGN